jgi:ATP-binding cassette subfamily B (MDR/TAP) protein 1
MSRLFEYNKGERPYLYLGLLAAAGNGCVFPIFSLFLSQMINVLSQLDPRAFAPEEREAKQAEVQEKGYRIALWFLIIGLCAMILWTLQIYLLTIVGERLTLKIRRATFQKLLRMPIPFYDIPKNNAGTLTSRLSVDAKLINGTQ